MRAAGSPSLIWRPLRLPSAQDDSGDILVGAEDLSEQQFELCDLVAVDADEANTVVGKEGARDSEAGIHHAEPGRVTVGSKLSVTCGHQAHKSGVDLACTLAGNPACSRQSRRRRRSRYRCCTADRRRSSSLCRQGLLKEFQCFQVVALNRTSSEWCRTRPTRHSRGAGSFPWVRSSRGLLLFCRAM